MILTQMNLCARQPAIGTFIGIVIGPAITGLVQVVDLRAGRMGNETGQFLADSARSVFFRV